MDREKAQGVKGLQGINEDLSSDTLTSLKALRQQSHVCDLSTPRERWETMTEDPLKDCKAR